MKRFNWVLWKDQAFEKVKQSARRRGRRPIRTKNTQRIQYALSKNIIKMKLAEATVSFILEDFVEVGLQFFYFEKYALLPNDLLVYFNAVIMVLKALPLTIRMILQLKNKWNPAAWGVSDPVYSGSFWWKLFKILFEIMFVLWRVLSSIWIQDFRRTRLFEPNAYSKQLTVSSL